MIIKGIRVKNFRSIADLEIDLAELTVVMGDNDVGKSNILRAINLFFNNRTDGNRPFYFPYDFNHHAVVATNKAKEIVIELTLTPPSNYKNARDIRWRKVWRRDGFVPEREVRLFVDGSEISGRTKFNTWLSRIRYKYVPATKGLDYFSELLGDLHDSLSSTVDDQIKQAAKAFTTTINRHTQAIFEELAARLGIRSSIQLPADLKTLFASLDFQSDTTQLSLQQRGDGIKARHIPIILRFLADQDNALRDHGSPKFSHVWGYEEPENNLEFSKAFALAKEFIEYSNEVQVILTTHSPAFYGLHQSGANVYHVFKNMESSGSVVTRVDLASSGQLDELMGVMPVVAPHVENAVANYQALLETANELIKNQTKKATLFVEGPSDVTILRRAFSIFAREVQEQITIKTSDHHGGGEGFVTDMLTAWLHNREVVRAAGLFDGDAQGSAGKKKVTANPKYSKQREVRVFTLKASQRMQSIFQKGLTIGIAVEEMLSAGAWSHAQNRGWLEQRTDLIAQNPKLGREVVSVSLTAALESRGFDADELLILSNKIGRDYKAALSSYVSHLSADNARDVLADLEPVVLTIAEHLVPGSIEI
ncbi:ATP-dependent endonuclease [Massilia sp. YIM B04103]|uniref:ATP-dependent nuclease n=1 Tax=Massilia sp. YIM B04103 TaxID=2963106 RepID=UPI002109E5C3|nr:AAA family ATPase [Massilia sp. YIM B04103]